MMTTKLDLPAFLLALGILTTTSQERAFPQELETRAAPHQQQLDQYGDALPAGAVGRLGSIRWRPGEEIDFLAFAAAGKLVVARELYGVFHIYDVATGKEVRRLGSSQRALERGSYTTTTSVLSNGGRFLASIGGKERILHVWEVSTGKEIWKLNFAAKSHFVVPVAFTADGQMLATWEENSHTLYLRETTTGKERGHLQPPVSPPTTGVSYPPKVTFAPDGATLATAGLDGIIYLWKVPAGTLVRKLGNGADPQERKHTLPVFSSDGKTLTALSTTRENDKTVSTATVWDVESGKETRRIKGPEEGFTSGALRADGTFIAWAGADHVIWLQEMGTGKIRHRLGEPGLGAVRFGPVYSPDGKTVFVRHGYEENQLWDAQTGRLLWKRQNGFFSTPAAFSPDGKTLAMDDRPCWGGVIRLLNTVTSQEIGSTGSHEGAIDSLRISGDGKTVTTSGTDQTVRQWEAATGKELRQFTFPQAAVALSRDGQRVAIAKDDNGVRKIEIWDLAVSRKVQQLEVLQGIPRRLAYSPDGRTLAAENLAARGKLDYLFCLYDLATGKERRLIDEPHDQYLDHILFSPDGTTLATAWSNESDPGVVYLWQMNSGKQKRRLQMPEGIHIQALAFSPDGRTLAMLNSTTATPNTIVLWETTTGKERCRIKGGAMAYDSAAIAFSPDGRNLAVCGADLIIRLWNIRTGKMLGQFVGHQGGVTCLAFTGDGKKLISGAADTTALVWDAVPILREVPATANDLTATQLESYWTALAGSDGGKAFEAVSALSASPRLTLSWFQERVKPAIRVEEKRLAQLIADLDDENFAVREKASLELEKLHELAQPLMKKVLEDRPSLELARRVQRLLDRLEPEQQLPPEVVQMVRAVEVLEQLGTPEAQRLLQTLAEGAPGARLTRESQAAIKRLEVP